MDNHSGPKENHSRSDLPSVNHSKLTYNYLTSSMSSDTATNTQCATSTITDKDSQELPYSHMGQLDVITMDNANDSSEMLADKMMVVKMPSDACEKKHPMMDGGGGVTIMRTCHVQAW